MKQLALYDFLRHIKRNIFVAVLVAVICLVSASLYSLYSYEYGRYKPFEKLNCTNGFFAGCKYAGSFESLNGFEETVENLNGVESIYEVYQTGVSISGTYRTAYLYDEWIWKNWEARLKSGSWFGKYENDSDNIPIILGGNTEEYSVGDILTIKSGREECKGYVKGILQDNTEILYKDSYHASDTTYDSCYSVPEGDDVFILLQKEVADENDITSIGTGVWAIVEYSNGLSNEEIDKLNGTINRLIGVTGITYSKFVELSESQLEGKILVYIPMIMSSIILGFVSLFTIAFVNVEKGVKYYSIYSLTGASKRQCFQIASGNVSGTIILSVILFVLGNKLILIYTRKANITYSMMSGAIILTICIYALFTLFLLLCMYLAMRANSPLKLLRKHQ
jgi:hypothetical protein